jgi:hypothetical protein
MVLGAAAVIAVAGIVVALLVSRSGGDDPAIAGLRRFDGLSRNHVREPVMYDQNPPVGGDHYPIWQNCGFYAEPVANENAVHSLEHGAVWITFRLDLAEDQVARLRSLAAGDKVLVSPIEGLPAPVVASAWGRQVRLSSATDPRLAVFLESFTDGSQAPEEGGPCTGGVGTPEP